MAFRDTFDAYASVMVKIAIVIFNTKCIKLKPSYIGTMNA